LPSRPSLAVIGKARVSSAFPAQAAAAGIPLTSFGEHRQIDLTIDGADEVERGTLNLIKGLGGALLHEKIVAAASRRLAREIFESAVSFDDPVVKILQKNSIPR
jgi:ribose 5-phosphate isomerase